MPADTTPSPWTCGACGTQAVAQPTVCPLCGSSPEELARLPKVKARRRPDGSGEPTAAGGRLPWFFGFLLLFPPALLAYALYKLIVWAGTVRLPEEEPVAGTEWAERSESRPENGEGREHRA